MPALDAAGRTAHHAFWAKRFGRFSLHKECVQDKLSIFFAGRGETVGELPLDVDKDNLEQWAEEWRQKAEDAGVASRSDREAIVNWLKEKTKVNSKGGAVKTDTVQRVLDSLASAGTTLPNSAHSAVSKVLHKSRRAADRSEYTRIETVFTVYFGMLPSALDEEWYDKELAKLTTACNDCVDTDEEDDVATINVRLAPSAVKVLSKDAGTPTLERVLKVGGDVMLDYFDNIMRQLTAMGLPAAAQMFHTVVSYPVRRHKLDERLQRSYLQRYFFVDFLGRGLLHKVAKDSLALVTAQRVLLPAAGILPPARPAAASLGSAAGAGILATPGSMQPDDTPANVAVAQLVQMLAAVGGKAGGETNADEPGTSGTQPAGPAISQRGSELVRELCSYCGVWHKNAGKNCAAFKADQAKAVTRAKAAEEARKAADALAKKAAAASP